LLLLYIADSIKGLTSDDLAKYPNLGMLVKKNGTTGQVFLKEGDTMYLPKLGELLASVAENGAQAFYKGISQDLENEVKCVMSRHV
jgi:gamma-glutamyltranspeptidase